MIKKHPTANCIPLGPKMHQKQQWDLPLAKDNNAFANIQEFKRENARKTAGFCAWYIKIQPPPPLFPLQFSLKTMARPSCWPASMVGGRIRGKKELVNNSRNDEWFNFMQPSDLSPERAPFGLLVLF